MGDEPQPWTMRDVPLAARQPIWLLLLLSGCTAGAWWWYTASVHRRLADAGGITPRMRPRDAALAAAAVPLLVTGPVGLRRMQDHTWACLRAAGRPAATRGVRFDLTIAMSVGAFVAVALLALVLRPDYTAAADVGVGMLALVGAVAAATAPAAVLHGRYQEAWSSLQPVLADDPSVGDGGGRFVLALAGAWVISIAAWLWLLRSIVPAAAAEGAVEAGLVPILAALGGLGLGAGVVGMCGLLLPGRLGRTTLLGSAAVIPLGLGLLLMLGALGVIPLTSPECRSALASGPAELPTACT